jgi:hypothetical protein
LKIGGGKCVHTSDHKNAETIPWQMLGRVKCRGAPVASSSWPASPPFCCRTLAISTYGVTSAIRGKHTPNVSCTHVWPVLSISAIRGKHTSNVSCTHVWPVLS